MVSLNFTELPPELLVSILRFMDAQDLAVIKQVCRIFLHLVQDTVELQYKCSLDLAGMIDEPDCRLSHPEKLEKLRSLQRMCSKPALIQGKSISRKLYNPYAVSPGLVFAQENENGGIDFLQFPCPLFGTEERAWTIHEDKFDVHIWSICMDPSQDLLIVTGSIKPFDHSNPSNGQLRFLCLSGDGAPHPFAAHSHVSTQSRPGKRLLMQGDLVGLEVPVHYGFGSEVQIWNWRTGHWLYHLLSEHDRGYESFAFLDTHYVTMIDGWQVVIHELDPSRASMTSLMKKDSLVIYQLLESSDTLVRPTWYQVGCGRSCGSPRRNTHQPFYPSSRRQLLINYDTSIELDRLSYTYLTGATVLPLSMIRGWYRTAQEDGARGHFQGKWQPGCLRVPHQGLPSAAEVQGMHAMFVSVHRHEDRFDLQAGFIDYQTSRGSSDQWGIVAPNNENTLRLPARPILVDDTEGRDGIRLGGDIVVIPDHAILQEYQEEGGIERFWQAYYITASDE